MSIKGLNMIGPHHVCVLYVATAGLQGSLMGSDEQEIVLLIYVIVDVVQNKDATRNVHDVTLSNWSPKTPTTTTLHLPEECSQLVETTWSRDRGVLWRFSRDETRATAVIPTERIEELFLLRGRSDSGTDSEKVRAAGAIWVFPLDVASLLHCLDKHTAKTSLTLEMTIVGVQQYPIRPQTADINENILSEQLTSESVLTDELIKSTGRQLEDALNEFDAYCSSLHVDPHSAGFRLVTDGQLPLRQCLYPEACRKEIDLPRYYSTFHDLRKEVARFTRKTDELPQSVPDMLECILLTKRRDGDQTATRADFRWFHAFKTENRAGSRIRKELMVIMTRGETIATRVYALAETQSRLKIPDLGVPWSSHKLAPPTAFRWLPIESLPRRSNLNNTNHSRVTRPRRSRPKSGLFCSGTVNKIDVTDGFVEFLRFFLVSLKAEADDLKSVTADVYREGSEAPRILPHPPLVSPWTFLNLTRVDLNRFLDPNAPLILSAPRNFLLHIHSLLLFNSSKPSVLQQSRVHPRSQLYLPAPFRSGKEPLNQHLQNNFLRKQATTTMYKCRPVIGKNPLPTRLQLTVQLPGRRPTRLDGLVVARCAFVAVRGSAPAEAASAGNVLVVRMPRLNLQIQTDLQVKPEAENEFYKREAKDMVNIVQRLILEGGFTRETVYGPSAVFRDALSVSSSPKTRMPTDLLISR
nr:hypothetical protein GEV33_015020 [Tenebrio molitor]